MVLIHPFHIHFNAIINQHFSDIFSKKNYLGKRQVVFVHALI